MDKNKIIHKFAKNTKGKDYVVGDIHGMFSLLERSLEEINFNPDTDRLFSVGDILDRGSDCTPENIIKWLNKDWFFPVYGNHEEIFFLSAKLLIPVDNIVNVGAKWVLGLKHNEIEEIGNLLNKMPLAIEVETDKGKIGIIHADCPYSDWNRLIELVTGPHSEHYFNYCLWSPNRVTSDTIVKGVDALIVGHMTQKHYTVNGNVHLIDTGAVYKNGYFTILDLNTLEPMPIQF